MPLTVDGQNAAADGVAGAFPYVALFNGNPESGGVEITGASYARKQLTLPAASTGQTAATNVPLDFDVDIGTPISHWGLMSALTAGARGASGAFTSPVTTTTTTFTVNSAVIDPLAS